MVRVIVHARGRPRECPDELDPVLRLSTVGAADWVEIAWPDQETSVVVPGRGSLIQVWALAVKKVSHRGGDPPHMRHTTLGIGVVSLGKTEAEIVDPSDDYSKVVTVLVETDPGTDGRLFDFRRLTLDMQRMTRLRMAYNGFWETTGLRPLVAAVQRMHLRRFTTSAGDLPAAAFVRVGHAAAPPPASAVSRRLSDAASMHGWTLEDVLEVLRDFWKSPSKTPLLVKAIEISADALTSVGTANDYVGDHVLGARAAERFQISVSFLCCEERDNDETQNQRSYGPMCGVCKKRPYAKKRYRNPKQGHEINDQQRPSRLGILLVTGRLVGLGVC